MTTINQIKSFIKKYNIENELKKSFSNLLIMNDCEDLNIKDKNIEIDKNNIQYVKTTLGFHLFKTSILKNNEKIGYYALEYDENFEIIDDYFINKTVISSGIL